MVRHAAEMPRVEEVDVQLGAAGIVSLASALFVTESTNAEQFESFAKWLDDRLLRDKLETDSQLRLGADESVKRLFVAIGDNSGRSALEMRALQYIFERLPTTIKESASLDQDFMAKLGLKTFALVQSGAIRFDIDKFWRAAHLAISTGEASLTVFGSDEVAIVRYKQDQQIATLEIDHPSLGKPLLVGDNLLLVLSDSPTTRQQALENHRFVFDLRPEVFQQAAADIASTEDAVQRMKKANQLREESAIVFYSRLHEKLKEQKTMSRDDLMPEGSEGLMGFLRLPKDLNTDDFSTALIFSAAHELVTTLELSRAISRLVGLPVPLSEEVITRLRALSTREMRELVKKLLDMSGSPTSNVHLIRILLSASSEHQAFLRLARRLAGKLLHPAMSDEFAAYHSVLRWAAAEFRVWTRLADRREPVRLLLVWSHAHQIFAILKALGVRYDWIRGRFDAMRHEIPIASLEGNSLENDISQPAHLSREVFSVAGMHYCAGAEAGSFWNEALAEKFKAHAMIEVEGARFPATPLLCDSSGAIDRLGSFLHGDTVSKLAVLLGEAEALRLKDVAGAPLVNQCLVAIEKEPNDPPCQHQ